MKRSHALILPLLVLFTELVAGEVFNHDEQHCHDVSVWGEVEYKQDGCEKCETKFDLQCREVRKEVCDSVPSTTCELVPYTDCRFYMEEVTFNETVVVTDGEYVPWECFNFTQKETHIKLVPQCVNVTRQDCVTKWVVNSRGQKVWDGNEQCRPVTWQNCTLREVPKQFDQVYTKCTKTGVPIPTMQCKLEESRRITTGIRCEVKSVVDCKCTHRSQCKEILYQECREVALPTQCQTTNMRVPFQQKIHRVKCLLADGREVPKISAEESAKEASDKLNQGRA